jgi:hypothetical protein
MFISYPTNYLLEKATPTGGAPMEKKSMNSPDEIRTF